MLDKWIDKRIDKRLKKDGFMRVPTFWREDYKQLTEKNQALSKILREIGREYNTLLEEFANEKSITWLKNALKEINIETKEVNKENLIKLYVEAFAVNFEDDIEEEIR